jgi:hypothetical protein
LFRLGVQHITLCRARPRAPPPARAPRPRVYIPRLCPAQKTHTHTNTHTLSLNRAAQHLALAAVSTRRARDADGTRWGRWREMARLDVRRHASMGAPRTSPAGRPPAARKHGARNLGRSEQASGLGRGASAGRATPSCSRVMLVAHVLERAPARPFRVTTLITTPHPDTLTPTLTRTLNRALTRREHGREVVEHRRVRLGLGSGSGLGLGLG